MKQRRTTLGPAGVTALSSLAGRPSLGPSRTSNPLEVKQMQPRMSIGGPVARRASIGMARYG